jgi:hypothetical protein
MPLCVRIHTCMLMFHVCSLVYFRFAAMSDNMSLDYEYPFVGRNNFLQNLADKWLSSDCRIFCIFGMRSVGKTRVVREFMKSRAPALAQSRGFKSTKSIFIDFRRTKNINRLRTPLYAALGLQSEMKDNDEDDDSDWLCEVCSRICADQSTLYLICFDNAEDIIDMNTSTKDSSTSPDSENLKDRIQSAFVIMVKKCVQNTCMFIASTTRWQFTQIKKIIHSEELLPMTHEDASKLLCDAAPGTNMGEYADRIVELCGGLPLVLLMVAGELEEDYGVLEPKDMLELLSTERLKALSREFYPREDRIGKL